MVPASTGDTKICGKTTKKKRMRATNTPSLVVVVVCVVVALVSHLTLFFVRANHPVVRFRNKTVGIIAESGKPVFVASENVTITGDVEVKTETHGTVNVTEKVDLLTDLQNDLGQRVVGLARHTDMGVVDVEDVCCISEDCCYEVVFSRD